MKKLSVLLMSVFFASMLFVFPLQAEDVTTTVSVTLSEEEIACMQEAVTVRDEALLEAYTEFSETAKAALEVRREELVEAWGLGDTEEIRLAARTAWQTYRRSIVMGRIALRRAKRSAWSDFRETRDVCLPDLGAGTDSADIFMDAQL